MSSKRTKSPSPRKRSAHSGSRRAENPVATPPAVEVPADDGPEPITAEFFESHRSLGETNRDSNPASSPVEEPPPDPSFAPPPEDQFADLAPPAELANDNPEHSADPDSEGDPPAEDINPDAAFDPDSDSEPVDASSAMDTSTFGDDPVGTVVDPPSEPTPLALAPRIKRPDDEFELNPQLRGELVPAAEHDLRTAAESDRVREAVRQVVHEGRVVSEVARDLGLAPSSIYRWEKRYLDFLSDQTGTNRREDWDEVHTWTGAPEIPTEWKLRFADNWERLLEVTRAEAADFRQDPLEIFLHQSMLTGWLYRDGRFDRNVAFGASVGIVFVLVLLSFLRSRSDAPNPVPAQVAPPDSTIADKIEIARARPVAIDFLRADGWQNKLAFVRDADRVRPKMEAWYQSHSDAGHENVELSYALRSGGAINVMATFEPEAHDPVFLSLVEENGSYKVDWETSSGYQHQSWAELVAQRPTNPILLRCIIERADYYNFEFSDPEKWLALKLHYPRGPVTLYGYAERRSPLGARLDGLLEFRSHAGVVIEAAFTPDSKSPNQLRILQLVHESWIPDTASADAQFPPGR